jgi:hypothetical protein
MFLAVAVALLARAALHAKSDTVTGIAFLVTVVCLVLLFEKIFPSVYPSSLRHPTKWWQTRAGLAVGAVAFGIIISILSSRIATLWFGLTVIGSALVALLLRARRVSDGL